MQTDGSLSQHFESLGDNCEFGFVQRAAKLEQGGLLRWAVAPPAALVAAIENGFANLYEFENLFASSDSMVGDKGTGLWFHTKMHSKEKVFVHAEPDRKAIWAEESHKLAYLREKLNEQLQTGEKHFVYKTNSAIPDAVVVDLAAAIAKAGPSKLLFVTADGPQVPGTVRHASDNLFIGRIDRFAPYSQADDVSFDVWHQILANAIGLMGLPSEQG